LLGLTGAKASRSALERDAQVQAQRAKEPEQRPTAQGCSTPCSRNSGAGGSRFSPTRGFGPLWSGLRDHTGNGQGEGAQKPQRWVGASRTTPHPASQMLSQCHQSPEPSLSVTKSGLATALAEPSAVFFAIFPQYPSSGVKKNPKISSFHPSLEPPPQRQAGFLPGGAAPGSPHATSLPQPWGPCPPPAVCPGSPLARRRAREKRHHMKLGNFVVGKFKKMEARGVGLGGVGRNNPALKVPGD